MTAGLPPLLLRGGAVEFGQFCGEVRISRACWLAPWLLVGGETHGIWVWLLRIDLSDMLWSGSQRGGGSPAAERLVGVMVNLVS